MIIFTWKWLASKSTCTSFLSECFSAFVVDSNKLLSISFSNSTTFAFTSSNSFLIFVISACTFACKLWKISLACAVAVYTLASFEALIAGDFCQWLSGSTITTGYIDHHHHQCCECRLESHFDCPHICKLYVKRRGAIQYRKKKQSKNQSTCNWWKYKCM